MKNNIEDIKILEEFIDGLKQYNPKTGKDIKPIQFGEGQRYVYSNVYYAIEHILSDYKRVLKENEELKKDYYNVINKIENKIDRFDYEFEKVKKQNNKDKSDYYWNLIINFTKLLESEE